MSVNKVLSKTRNVSLRSS